MGGCEKILRTCSSRSGGRSWSGKASELSWEIFISSKNGDEPRGVLVSRSQSKQHKTDGESTKYLRLDVMQRAVPTPSLVSHSTLSREEVLEIWKRHSYLSDLDLHIIFVMTTCTCQPPHFNGLDKVHRLCTKTIFFRY